MEYKILFGGDLHKRMKDISTIRGYCDCFMEVQKSLMVMISELGITHFVSLGDWYDKGYGTDVGASLAHTDIDELMSAQLKGNFYGVIGNHIRLNMDSNPELHLIQPHPSFKSRHPIVRKEQVIKTPNRIRLGDVQISLMHYNATAESAYDYKPMREEGVKYHVAVFHTQLVIPSSTLSELNPMMQASTNPAIQECMDNVDLAIVGHIHKPLGKVTIPHKNMSGQTLMVIPGSLTNTDAGEGSRHYDVNLPLLTITDNDVQLSFVRFDLKTNLVKFDTSVADKKKLLTTRGNPIKEMYENGISSITPNGEIITSLGQFFRVQGYTTADRNMVKTIMRSPEDLKSIVAAYKEGADL